MSTQEERINVFTESLKEGGRVVLLGLVAYLLTEGVVNQLLDVVFGMKLDNGTKVMVSGFLTSLLKALDKWLHETAKLEPVKTRNEGVLGEKGLTGF